MALKTCGLPMAYWQHILPDALHSLCSLLCMATNCSPHEWLLKYARRSSVGGYVPSWLITPGPVLLKCHVHTSKDDLLVDELALLQDNRQEAHIPICGRPRDDCVSNATRRLFPRILTFMMFFQHLMYRKPALVHMVMNYYMKI